MSTRIAVFTEILPPVNDEIAHVSYNLLRSLAEQDHELRIFSTYRERDELPTSQNRIEILRPFRNWSFLELPRLIPLLMEFKPDLIHIIHPRAQMTAFGWSKLTMALPTLARFNNQTPVVTSLYDRLKPAHETKLMPLLKLSDLITVSQPSHHTELAMHAMLSDRDVRLLPMSGFEMPTPALSESTPDNEGMSEGIFTFTNLYPEFIFVPGRLEAHSSVGELIAHLKSLGQAGYGVLVGSSPSNLDIIERRQLENALHRESWGQRVLFTGSLSAADEDRLMRKAYVTSVASLPAESLSLSRYVRAAARRSAPLLLLRKQVETDFLAWEHEKNALVVDQMHGISHAMERVKSDSDLIGRLRQSVLELGSRDAADSPANLMSRWYTELLERRY